MIALHRSVHRIIKLHRVILRNSDRSWKIEVDSNRFPPLLRCIAVIVRLLPSIVCSLRRFYPILLFSFSFSFDLWSVSLFLLGYDKSRSLFPVLFFLFDGESRKGKDEQE